MQDKKDKKGREMEQKGVKDNTGSLSSLQKAWEALLPCLLYYLAYSAANIILAFVLTGMMESLGESCQSFMTGHAATVAGVAGGIGMLLGILPLVPMLNRELLRRDCVKCSADKAEGRGDFHGTDGATGIRHLVYELFMTVILAFCSSLGLNILLTLTGFAESSQAYQEVAGRQYGVAFGVGIILYGVVSPLAEEVVFRGLVYNRLRRFYPIPMAIVMSALLFGAFHGNLVQGVYGGCMGILMAWLYERTGRFFDAVLFHAVANLAVYVTAYMEGVRTILFVPAGCAVLLAASAACVFLVEKDSKKKR